MENIAVVVFPNDYSQKQYEFKNHIKDLNVGDFVVVDSRKGFEVAQVVDFEDYSKVAYKWTVCKVDTKQYLLQLEREEKLKELKVKMEERRKKVQELEVYRILAKEDSEMARLLKEYESITRGDE